MLISSTLMLENHLSDLCTMTSKKGKTPLFSFSHVKCSAGCNDLSVLLEHPASTSFSNTQKMSSTSLKLYFGPSMHASKQVLLEKLINIFNIGPKGLPIAIPSICLYMILLKLNYLNIVVKSINSIKAASGGVTNGYITMHQHKYQ